ncbi:WG repeat-containing protein [Clostridium ljungdahlii]
MVVEPSFNFIDEFSNGMALVNKNSKYGFWIKREITQ